MAPYRVGDLILEVSKIFALRGNSAATRGIPIGHKETGILARLHLEKDFFHVSNTTVMRDGGQAASDVLMFQSS